MKGKLTLLKRKNTKGGIRTQTVQGEFDHYPRKGNEFVMTAPALIPIPKEQIPEGWDHVRSITTSPVVKLRQNKKSTVFETENSVYRLEYDIEKPTQ